MKHLKKFENNFDIDSEINQNTNGLLKKFKEDSEERAKEIYLSKIKKCFEEEYNFTFELLRDAEYFGERYAFCLINDIPMKISLMATGSIQFDLDGLVRRNMDEIIQNVTGGKKTAGPEFLSVLEVVAYFEKNNMSIKANPNLKPIVKTGLFN